MATSILEILTKCERRLSKKAKRADLHVELCGQDIFELCETSQSDEWQRLFIATIQLYIETLQTNPSQLKFQILEPGKTVQLIINNITDSMLSGESFEKLQQTSQQLDAVTLLTAEKRIELIFDLFALSATQNTSKRSILCADDNPDNRQIMQLLLEKMGHKVTTAENGQLALEATLEQEFDLIFLDIQMPVMDGIEALELIRSTACETPIIAFTAQVFDHEVAQLLELEFNAWLAKPIDRSKLDSILRDYLDDQNTSQTIEFGEDELAQLKHTYQQSLTQYIEDMGAAVTKQDTAQMARLAHALKGSGGNFGFDDITQIAGQLEQACYQNTDTIPADLTNELISLLKEYKI